MEMLSTSSLLRAGGVAAAVLLPERTGWRARAALTGSTYALSSAVDPGSVQVLSVELGDDRFPDWLNRGFPMATAVWSWMLAQQAVVPVVRRLPLPRPVTSLALGAAVYAADRRLARTVRESRARAAATPESGAQASG